MVRHGQSVADVEERMEGRANFPLTELGRSQAKALSRWMQDYLKPDVILSSPLDRATETARIIGDHFGIPFSCDDNLLDWNHGVLAGMLRTEANEKFPEKPGGLLPHEVIKEGESAITLRGRSETFLSEVTTHPDYADKTIVVVSHSMTINALFEAFLRLPIASRTRILGRDAAIHHWRIADPYRYIVFVNQETHVTVGVRPDPTMPTSYPNYRVAVEAIIRHRGRVLLTKRSASANVFPGVWTVPAGKVKYAELPRHALFREVLEETNLAVDWVAELDVRTFSAMAGMEPIYRLVFTYLVTPKSDSIDGLRLNNEHEEYVWADYQELGSDRYQAIHAPLRALLLQILESGKHKNQNI